MMFACQEKQIQKPRNIASQSYEVKSSKDEYKVAMILLDFTNAKTSKNYPIEAAEKSMQHIHDYFYSMSRGTIDFNLDANGDNKMDIFVVPLNYAYSEENKGLICGNRLRNDHINAINQTSDVSLYNHFIFVSSRSATPTQGENTGLCGFTGKGVKVWPGRYDYASVRVTDPNHDFAFIHELGHTLNLKHSGTFTDIHRDNHNDPACFMSYSYRFNHPNAPKSHQLGIFRNNPAAIEEVDESGTYTIENLSTRSEGIPKILNIGYFFYVSLRSLYEEDTTIPENSTGIHIHQIFKYEEAYSYLHKFSPTQISLKNKNDKVTFGRYTIELLNDLTPTSLTADINVTVDTNTCDLDYNNDGRFSVTDIIHLRKVDKKLEDQIDGKYYYKRVYEQIDRLKPVLLKQQSLAKAMRWFNCDSVIPKQ